MGERLVKLAAAAGRGLRRVRVRGIPRLMYWSAPWLVGRGLRTVPTASGAQLSLDVGDYFCCMMFFGRFAPEIVALLRSIVRPGDSVLDVGAQLGYMTTHLARLVGPTGHVHSFEPDPNALARLRTAVAANDLRQVKIFAMAASDRDEDLTLNVSPTLGWSTAVQGTHLENLTAVSVRGARIDSLVTRGEIARPVSVVKIDVEGFEASVLDGMQELIARDRPYVVLEINPVLLGPTGHSARDVLERVTRHGSTFSLVGERRGVFGGEELELTHVDPRDELGFCDVVCIPEGRPIPRAARPT